MTNTMIRASAGSGKTFQLSNRYLGLVFQDKPVDSILASTFTRKAAGEILDRILLRLADASLDSKKYEELARFIENIPGSVESLLADMARNLYRLRISTLDAFFNKIASTFALELKLPPSWEILDEVDSERYIAEAVQNVLAESHRNDARNLMNLLQQGEQDRSITQELFSLAKNLLSLVRETTPDVWIHDDLLKKELSDDDLNNIFKRLERANVPKTGKGKPDSRFEKAREKLCVHVQNGDWTSVLGNGLANGITTNHCQYYKTPIEGDLLDSVQELVEQATAVQINELVGRTKATRQLLDLILESYDEILYREHGLRFEDVTDKLAKTSFMPNLETLAHRIDAKTEHLLLDEFQDTSLLQWKVIEPFVQAAGNLQENGSVFVVGDVKQAIYGWRGGEAEIFNAVSDTIPVQKESLDKSYRSSPVVIDTVNQLFSGLKSNPALEKYPKAVESWEFETHQTEKNSLPGYCVLEIAQDSDEDGDEEDSEGEPDKWNTKYKVERIAELHRTKPGKSIGVLVSRNEKIGKLIAELKLLGIEASEEGGNPLYKDSAAVQHVLSAMILADHPGDKIARFHLANGPLAEKLQLNNYKDDAQAAKCSRKLRRELIDTGYGAVVEDLARTLASACNRREFERLKKLTELAYQFQGKVKGVRTDRFIRVVQSTKVESPSAESIRIMTIHKSKGLEFDIVVLPDLDNRLVKQNPPVMVARENPTSPVTSVIRYADETLQAFLPDKYRKAFEYRKHREVKESLSVLYVAMTRAKHELVMIVPEKSRNGNATYAGILRCGLAPNSEPKQRILFKAGTAEWGMESGKWRVESEQKSEMLICRLDTDKKLTRNMIHRSPSSYEEFPHSPLSASHSPRLNRDDALLWGTAMHACFERGVRWLDDDKPNTDFLFEKINAAVMGKKGNVDPQKVVDEFLAICGKSVIKAVLSRSAYPADERVDVEHERRFAVRLDNIFLRGSVDRLVIRRKGEKVIGLEIIDYKTDRLDEGRSEQEFIEERQAFYAGQINAYRCGMAKLYGIDSSQIDAKLVFVSIPRVQEMPHTGSEPRT
jgi:ATP-dependent exoDNAse (exonuclease V) beta subunit